MSEYLLQFIAFGKILWVAVFGLFYGLGGIYGKWKRRYFGSAWILFGVIIFSLIYNRFNLWFLSIFPLFIGSLSIGYGADQLIKKIIKRILYGLVIGICPISLAIINGMYALWALNIVVCILFSVALGVFNITKNARDEETLIATAASLLTLFMA